jgi:hypothetical protein
MTVNNNMIEANVLKGLGQGNLSQTQKSISRF